MYDRVGLYRGKKSLCCVNNSKRHLTKRFMGYAGGYQALYRSRVCQQRDSDADGTAHDEQPPEEPGVCPQQKRIDYRWLRQRQDEIFRQTESHAMRVGQISLFVRCDRPEGQHPR